MGGCRSVWCRVRASCRSPHGGLSDRVGHQTKYTNGVFIGRLASYVNRMEKIMKRMISIALLLAGSALLAGCPKKHNVIEPPTAGAQVAGSSNAGQPEGAQTAGRSLDGDASSDVNGGANAVGVLAKRVIYFDFDK